MSFKRNDCGMRSHTLFKTWSGMINRCYSSLDKDYVYYGGRGIVVCSRWQSFECFIKDMGVRPSRCTLDRINNNKGYSPDNCRWATPIEQANNKRNNRKIVVDGVEFTTLAAASRHFGMPESTLRNRLYSEKAKSATTRAVATKNVKHDVGNGVFMTIGEIAKEVGVTRGAVEYRIKKGWSGQKLISNRVYSN